MARILLVDDDHDIRELGKALLTHSGHETHVADGAISALQVLREYEIDLLITDINMPNFSGFDLLKMIRIEGLNKQLTICVLTARRDERDIQTAVRAGAHDYIVKPLDPNLFLRKINELLLKRPVRERSADDFVAARVKIPAKATLDTEIRSVSELGIIIRTPHQFRPGTMMQFDSELFYEISIPAPYMRVFSCQKVLGQWETRLSFMDLHDDSLAKIRDWIAQQTVKTKLTG
ncbi:MAG TPA: response regulator [Bdellovibrionales bacterium]|nr:response regulator [Bdellovibrionales bacterium]